MAFGSAQTRPPTPRAIIALTCPSAQVPWLPKPAQVVLPSTTTAHFLAKLSQKALGLTHRFLHGKP